jgi:hypothetical protein
MRTQFPLSAVLVLGLSGLILGGCVGVIEDQDGAVTLGWDAPTTNSDGTPLTDLLGYRIYVNATKPVNGEGSTMVDVGDVLQYDLQLGSGDNHVAVLAYDSESLESSFSNELTIRVP